MSHGEPGGRPWIAIHRALGIERSKLHASWLSPTRPTTALGCHHAMLQAREFGTRSRELLDELSIDYARVDSRGKLAARAVRMRGQSARR